MCTKLSFKYTNTHKHYEIEIGNNRQRYIDIAQAQRPPRNCD